uniref:Xylulose kinase n=1 Tax=Plectus sambesii TaxID=2011161 RepID=A0A914V2I0_9BILA
MAETYLGLDFSTQQLKAVLTNKDLAVVHTAEVTYSIELPEFGTQNGIISHADGETVTSPTLMWVKAFDKLLEKLKSQKEVDISSIKAISGCGQQHGSVFWRKGSSSTLANLDPSKTLAHQLSNAFSQEQSAIWMDSSTNDECELLEVAGGGREHLVKVTGSRAFHRFTGAQIAKVSYKEPHIYHETERISLVSSFACSLLIGKYASIDFADGSGMNLLDINKRDWDHQLLNACGSKLEEKLGKPVPTSSIAGKVASYYVKRYGFSADCDVVTFTGDNPSSLAGVNLHKGDVAVSCGTSDTIFASINKPAPAMEGHVFCNPVEEKGYMVMLCFKNGSLTRDRIRLATGCKSWDDFNVLLDKTAPGNSMNIGFYFDHPEILPHVAAGDYRFDPEQGVVDTFPPEVEARAVIEHQCLSKRTHAEQLGYKVGGRVVVTGGASANKHILQVLADVFKSEVFVLDVVNSAALGGCFRAKHVSAEHEKSFGDVAASGVQMISAAKPHEQNFAVYDKMATHYTILETSLMQ